MLDRQHPTRIMTPEIILLIKTGYKFPDLLDGEEETEERGDSDNPKRDNDVTVTYDPLADETHQDDDVSPEITRLLDQYEEPTEEEPPA